MQKIRLSKSCLGPEEPEAVGRILAIGYLGMGEETRQFEQDLCNWIGGDRQIVCVNTGTSALHLALSCLDIGPGDEVLVPTITYVACFQAVSAVGATAVACDVCEDDVFIDLDDAAKRVTKRTKAIMPVHYASQSAGMPDVYAFAARFGLRVVEDAAHSFGCLRDGLPVGREGDVVCFSFDGIKNITAAEGGAIVTGDVELAQRARDARLLGVERDTEARYRRERSWDFDVRHQGFRYHMSDINAAIGRTQLKKLERFAPIRRGLAQSYVQRLQNQPHVRLLAIDYDGLVPHIFPVCIQDSRRESVRRALEAQHIEWGFHYKPNHQLSMFAQNGAALATSEKLADELLTLPLHPDLTSDMMDRIVETVTRSVRA
jgi:dTDP-4-amino-4,6-dideoxygalactose transaminase